MQKIPLYTKSDYEQLAIPRPKSGWRALVYWLRLWLTLSPIIRCCTHLKTFTIIFSWPRINKMDFEKKNSVALHCAGIPYTPWRTRRYVFPSFLSNFSILSEFLKTNVNTFERVPTSEPDEVELFDSFLFRSPPTPTVICIPHVVKLQVPTTVDNITVSFEPKHQGPVVHNKFSL